MNPEEIRSLLLSSREPESIDLDPGRVWLLAKADEITEPGILGQANRIAGALLVVAVDVLAAAACWLLIPDATTALTSAVVAHIGAMAIAIAAIAK